MSQRSLANPVSAKLIIFLEKNMDAVPMTLLVRSYHVFTQVPFKPMAAFANSWLLKTAAPE